MLPRLEIVHSLRRFLPLLVVLAACATSPSQSLPVQTLTIENASIDVIRVSLDFGDRQMLLGRVEPMTRGRLRIPGGAVHTGSPWLRVLVYAVGAPTEERLPSEWYPGLELLRLAWRFTGRLVVPSGIHGVTSDRPAA